mmetsp:Transcript_8217/g.29977  ORF Transcript_8217/g.29977 Transcript_8217/m.29977 type:complete len:687 (-) Transcript_8217:87-2147(-)
MGAEEAEAAASAAAAAAIAVAGAVAVAHASVMGEGMDSPAASSPRGDREHEAMSSSHQSMMGSPASQSSPTATWRKEGGVSRMSNLYGADEASEVFAKFSVASGSASEGNGSHAVPRLHLHEDDQFSKASAPPSAREDAWASGTLALTGSRTGAARQPSRLDDPQDSGVESDSFDDHQRAISSLHRRQAEWDRQMEFHDQKQGELLTLQWKLMREQTGTLARELAIVQQQLQEMRVTNTKVRAEVDQFFRESDAKISEERSLRQSVAETLEQRLRKVRQEIDAELKAKVAPIADIQRKMQAAEEKAAETARDERALESEVAKLRKVVDVNTQDILALQQAVEQEAGERRNLEDSTLDMIRDLREALQKESKERANFHEEHLGKQVSRLDNERAEREQAHNALNQKLANLQKELAPQREEMPALRTRLQDLEALLNSRLKDNQKNIERELQERIVAQQKLERRVMDLQAVAEKEAAARLQQSEEFEQVLKNHRTKMKTLVGEQAEFSRQAREDLQTRLSDQLERETAMREAQRLDLMDQWTGCRSSLESRVDSFEGTLRTLEQQIRDEGTASMQAQEAMRLRQTDGLARQMRELGESFQAKLKEEREAREAQDNSLEEHMSFMDSFLQDVRQVFLQTGSRTRTATFRKSTGPSSRSALELGSDPQRSSPGQVRQPSRPPSPGARSNH